MSLVGEKFLPLGSIVIISGNSRKIMITGFYRTNNLDQLYYDYSGCPYPEGLLDNSKEILFNHNQIISLLYNGMKTEEEMIYKEKLKAFVSNMNQSQNQINSPIDNSTESGINVLNINNLDLTASPLTTQSEPIASDQSQKTQISDTSSEPKYIFGPDGTIIAAE